MQHDRLSLSIKRALFVAAGLALAPSAFAQADEAAQADSAMLDTIEVTGSRLKRSEVEGAVPVIVINREQIDVSGDVSVADVLRDTTFASFGNIRPQSGNTAQSLATINLRGLGSGRTLVLIDGRRAPTNPMFAAGGSDLNAIPLAAVDRIEILSDGASAVYGSEAIGGVVNVILRKDFNGAELRYGLGQTEVEGADTEEMSGVFGASNDTTRIIGGFSANKRGMLYTRDQIGGNERGVSIYGNNYITPSGLVRAVPGFDCTQGAFYMTSNGQCSFNFNSVAADEAKAGTKSVFTRGDHQINDDWTVYASATVTKVDTFGRYAPVPGVVVVDEGTPNDIVVGDGQSTTYFHRFAAAGNRDTFTDSTNSDYLVGFEGRLGDRAGIEFGLRRTDYKFLELGRGFIVRDLAEQFANEGRYNLSDPYGADPEVLAGMTATISRESRFKTDEVFAVMDFDLFEMGGGTSNAVVGAEYRDDYFQDLFDSLSEADQILGSSGNSASGTRKAKAAFFEWLLPFSTGFDVTLAGRFDDYSDFGNAFSPKVSMRWSPLDSLTLRASYGQGFRAPPLDILTQKPAFSAQTVSDPQSCVALGEDPDCELQVDTTVLGAPDLDAEESTQYSAGFVWSPLDWFDMSLDYYNIEVENTITAVSAQDVVDSDLNPDRFGPIPAGLRIVRDPVTGRITQIDSGTVNAGTLNTSGVDARFNTDFDLGDAGTLKNSLVVSYVQDFVITNTAGVELDQLDLDGAPELRAALQNGYSVGDWAFAWNVNYIGENGAYSSYTTHDVQIAWSAPWGGRISVGATNVGDRYPELIDFGGRPFNFNLYDSYGRTTYLRYTQAF